MRTPAETETAYYAQTALHTGAGPNEPSLYKTQRASG